METLRSLLVLIDGNKTKILAVLAIVIQALAIFDYLPQDKVNQLLLLLASGGVYTVRDAMKKLEPPSVQTVEVVPQVAGQGTLDADKAPGKP